MFTALSTGLALALGAVAYPLKAPGELCGGGFGFGRGVLAEGPEANATVL